MDKNENFPSIKDLADKKVPHGVLTGFSWSARTNGMMFNSDTLNSVWLQKWKDGNCYITVETKASMASKVRALYKVDESVFEKLTEVIERENMTAWKELKYYQEYIVYDYSSSEGMTLYYDNTSVGGYPAFSVPINCQAVRQQDKGEVVDELRAIIDKAIEEGSVISEAQAPEIMIGGMVGGGGAMMGLMGMGMLMNMNRQNEKSSSAPAEKPSGPWECKECGTENTGKFCCECGSSYAVSKDK